ncbi:MAG: TonB-dependent receptor, partial [Chlorobiales bacterium]|nr:TonB-dependent receptor [Chlorobiales bacterium]
LEVSGQYGQYSDTYGRRNLSLAYGKRLDKLSISVGGFIGQAQLSNKTYTDINGDAYNMKGQSEIRPLSVNVGIGYEGLSVRLFAEKYENKTLDNYDAITKYATLQRFETYAANVKYDFGIGKSLILTPQVSYLRQLPWNNKSVSTNENDYSPYYDKTVDRIKASLTTLYDYSKDLNFVFGGEFYRDKGVVNTSDIVSSDESFVEKNDQLSYNNVAFFAQGTYNSSFANFTLGARYDYNSTFGGFFAPRVAVTKVIDRFHFKLLADRAFRAPLVENISANPDIKPEYATVFEAEVGYQLSKSSFLSANFFYQTISDAIVYYTLGSQDNYTNAEKTGSRGMELEYRLKEKWGYLNLGYSFYATMSDDEVKYYAVPENKNEHLGFAPHKVTINSSFKITEKLSISPSVILLSKRDGIYAKDAGGNSEMREFKALALANLYVLHRDFLTPGLDAGAGVYDIFGQNYTFIQPYDGQHLPLPGPPREFVVRLAYHIGG